MQWILLSNFCMWGEGNNLKVLLQYLFSSKNLFIHFKICCVKHESEHRKLKEQCSTILLFCSSFIGKAFFLKEWGREKKLFKLSTSEWQSARKNTWDWMAVLFISNVMRKHASV